MNNGNNMKFNVVLLALVACCWSTATAATTAVTMVKGRQQRAPGDLPGLPQEPVHRENPRQCKNKCACNIAQSAAADAKAAQFAQNAAGCQAAHQVKTLLAEKALLAAKAAEAALSGKQALVEEIQQELKDTELVIAQDAAAVHQQQATVSAATQAWQQAAAVHKLMCQITQLAAATEKSTRGILERLKTELAYMLRNLEEAKKRSACLQKKLSCECGEAQQIKSSAKCACEAAKCACESAKFKRPDDERLKMRDEVTEEKKLP